MSNTTLDHFWKRQFFSTSTHSHSLFRQKNDLISTNVEKIINKNELWLTELFNGRFANSNLEDKILIYKNGEVIHEIALQRLKNETLIGRHPDVDIQLESYKLAMYHAVIIKNNNKFYIENLCPNNGILINRKKFNLKARLQLVDGMQVDLPGFRLEFIMPTTIVQNDEIQQDLEELDTIPEFFYTPPAPEPSPLLVNLVEDQSQLCVWSKGTTELKVVDIIQETTDCNTYRFVGCVPTLFSYKPGQFITFVLNVYGRQVKRSYSISSSPSRPYLLEITIKKVPDGLVSNWFFDQVRLGDKLLAKGPIGKFTCFNYPSPKMLFIGAGSGVTPIISMSRWITDTVSDVNVKLLASFKSPSDIIFRKELELLSARNNGFQVAVTVTAGWHGIDSWTGFTGRVSQKMLDMFTPDILERDIFMCGPETFSNFIKKILQEIGYDMSKFHCESFGTGRSQQAASGGKTLELKGKKHSVTFTRSELIVETDENINLLELAEAHGIELDYSCRTGSCGECEVKCSGEVYVNENCEIDEKTKTAGFIYSCCCSAKSDLILDV